MSKNEFGVSRLTKLVSIPTDERNGTSVKIKLKTTTSKYYSYLQQSDVNKWVNAVKTQLAYFDNVYVDGGGVIDADAKEFNESKIYHFDGFCYNPIHTISNIHIKLGQCTYEMPWHTIGTDSINIPIALDFKIGELTPTPNREGLIIDDDAKSLIRYRITQACNKLKELHKVKKTDLEDWQMYYRYSASYNNYRHKLEVDKDVYIDLYSILNNHDVQELTLKNVGRINTAEFLRNWNYHRKIKNVLTTISDRDIQFNPQHIMDDCKLVIFRIQKDYNKYTNKYISEVLYPNDTVWIIKAKKLTLRDYVKVLYLKDYPKDTWRRRIIAYQKLIASIWKNIPSYDDIVVPKDWIKNQYKKRQSRDLAGKAVCYTARTPNRTSDSCAAYSKHTYTYKELLKLKKFIIYGEKADRDKLDNVFRMTLAYKNIRVLYTAKSNHKMIEQLDNFDTHFLHVDTFISKYNRAFAKTVTAYKINKFIQKNSLMFNNIEMFRKHINHDIANAMGWLEQYKDKYWTERYSYTSPVPTKFMDTCWEMAVANKYYDHEAVAVLRKLWTYFDKIGDDLDYIKIKGYAFESGSEKVIRRLLKSKVKIDIYAERHDG